MSFRPKKGRVAMSILGVYPPTSTTTHYLCPYPTTPELLTSIDPLPANRWPGSEPGFKVKT